MLDGLKIPVFGLGVWQAECNGETEQVCLWAIENGYRMIDTATIYRFCMVCNKRGMTTFSEMKRRLVQQLRNVDYPEIKFT